MTIGHPGSAEEAVAWLKDQKAKEARGDDRAAPQRRFPPSAKSPMKRLLRLWAEVVAG